MEKNKHKILCTAGYHKEEEFFGSEVLSKLKKEFENQNIFFYISKNNELSEGGEICEQVEREYAAQINIINPDLLIDLHIGTLENVSRGKLRWSMFPTDSLKDPYDYAWYLDFVESQNHPRFLPSIQLINPFEVKSKYNTTWMVFETELSIESFSSRDSREVNREVGMTARFVKKVIYSYFKYKKRFEEDEKFRAYLKGILEDAVVDLRATAETRDKVGKGLKDAVVDWKLVDWQEIRDKVGRGI